MERVSFRQASVLVEFMYQSRLPAHVAMHDTLRCITAQDSATS